MSQQDDLWSALINIVEAAGMKQPEDSIGHYAMVDGLVPSLINRLRDADKHLDLTSKRKDQDLDRTSDLLASDLKALRAEMKKPMEALSLIHRLSVGRVFDGSSRARERLSLICLWALLGDDDYLTDAADRLALLGQTPAAAGPASGEAKPA